MAKTRDKITFYDDKIEILRAGILMKFSIRTNRLLTSQLPYGPTGGFRGAFAYELLLYVQGLLLYRHAHRNWRRSAVAAPGVSGQRLLLLALMAYRMLNVCMRNSRNYELGMPSYFYKACDTSCHEENMPNTYFIRLPEERFPNRRVAECFIQGLTV